MLLFFESGCHWFLISWLPSARLNTKPLSMTHTKTYKGLYMPTRPFNHWLPHRHQAGFSKSLFTLTGCIVVVIAQYINLCVWIWVFFVPLLFVYCFLCLNPDAAFNSLPRKENSRVVGGGGGNLLNRVIIITINIHTGHFNKMEIPQQKEQY